VSSIGFGGAASRVCTGTVGAESVNACCCLGTIRHNSRRNGGGDTCHFAFAVRDIPPVLMCSYRDARLPKRLGDNRTTNANILSMSREFLKASQGRWFQRLGRVPRGAGRSAGRPKFGSLVLAQGDAQHRQVGFDDLVARDELGCSGRAGRRMIGKTN